MSKGYLCVVAGEQEQAIALVGRGTAGLRTPALRVPATVLAAAIGLLLGACAENPAGADVFAGLDDWASGLQSPGIEVQSRTAGAFKLPSADFQHGGELHVAYAQAPESYNPLLARTAEVRRLVGLFQAPLARRNPFTFEYEPVLAESWTVSRDQKSVTFKLREGLLWSDGSPVTAADWVDAYTDFVYEEILGGPLAVPYVVEGRPLAWEAVNDLEFRYSLPFVHPALVTDFLESPPLPMHILGPALEQGGPDAVLGLWKAGGDVRGLPSTGHWKIESEVPGKSLSLVRNPQYFELDAAGRQLPYLAGIQVLFIPDGDARTAAFVEGTIDYLDITPAELGAFRTKLSASDGAAASSAASAGVAFAVRALGPELGVDILAFNGDPKESEADRGLTGPALDLLSKSSFRRAVVDFARSLGLEKNLPAGLGVPLDSAVYRFSSFWTDPVDGLAPEGGGGTATAGAAEAGLSAVAGPGPVARLVATLDELGIVDSDGNGIREFPDGTPAELHILTNSENAARVAIAVELAEALLEQGFRLIVDTPTFNDLVRELTSGGTWHLALVGMTVGPDPSSAANWIPSSGSLHLFEPGQKKPRTEWEAEVDLAWELGNNSLVFEDRRAAFARIQRILRDEAPWGVLYATPALAAVSPRFENLLALPVPGYGWEAFSQRIFVVGDSVREGSAATR